MITGNHVESRYVAQKNLGKNYTLQQVVDIYVCVDGPEHFEGE
jgi:hypothetical protein